MSLQCCRLWKEHKREEEAFMERMAEAERESRREQQKFSMDALKLLGNILKDVANAKE